MDLTILIAAPREKLGGDLIGCFDEQCHVHVVEGFDQLRRELEERNWDCLFVDLLLPGAPRTPGSHMVDPRALVQAVHQIRPALDIVAMSSRPRVALAVDAVEKGASHYLTYPLNPAEVRLIVGRIMRRRVRGSELKYLRDQFWRDDSLDIVQTRTDEMKQVFEKIRRVSPTRATVLLSGETGTGKSVIAKLIHRHSNRRNNPFISVNCGAIPETLIESELFGHEKGAFTGAHRRKLGKFEIAAGGTIFLDEIGTITPAAQVKLLTVLQDGQFQRVGGEVPHQADVRVIAATNADLAELCRRGQFRRDLYYRLNVFPIELPPLRRRVADIPIFIDFFIKKVNQSGLKTIDGAAGEVVEALKHYHWPGNLRELENLIERAHILENGPFLTLNSFPLEIAEAVDHPLESTGDTSAPASSLAQARRQGIEAAEKAYLQELLTRCRGRINQSASQAGVSTRQLHKLMQKYGLRKEDYKQAQQR